MCPKYYDGVDVSESWLLGWVCRLEFEKKLLGKNDLSRSTCQLVILFVGQGVTIK